MELIELGGLRIPGEVAAGVPLEPGERDDFPALAPKLSDPAVAGIILGTPVYFGNMSSLCKALLDRWIVFHKDKLLANKVGGVLAVGGGRNCGLELTIRSVQVALMAQAALIVVGDAPPTGHWGGTVWAGNPTVGNGPSPDIARDESGVRRSGTLAAAWRRSRCGSTAVQRREIVASMRVRNLLVLATGTVLAVTACSAKPPASPAKVHGSQIVPAAGDRADRLAGAGLVAMARSAAR